MPWFPWIINARIKPYINIHLATIIRVSLLLHVEKLSLRRHFYFLPIFTGRMLQLAIFSDVLLCHFRFMVQERKDQSYFGSYCRNKDNLQLCERIFFQTVE